MPNHSCGLLINGHHTDIVLNVYSNRIFLIVSQFKKFGSFITVNRQASVPQFNTDIYTIKSLLGKDDVDEHVAARYIAEHIEIDRPLLLSICLKNYDIEVLQSIVKVLNKFKTW